MMGAWGAGSFDNDAALDFADEIGGVDDVTRGLCAADELGNSRIEGEIDADIASQIIVAAECVAAMRGHPHPDLPEELAAVVAESGAAPMELYELARNNVSAVMGRSELCELWAEEGSGDWNRAMTDLMQRLNQPAADTGRTPITAKAVKTPTPNPSPCLFCDQPMGDEQFHMLDLTIHEDRFSTSKRGGWVHLQCLNAALHPKHMIQNWQFDDDQLEWLSARLKADREG